MRIVIANSILAALLILPTAAEERPDELVKLAVASSGGEEVLAKYPAGHLMGKGIMLLAGSECSFAFEQEYQVPARFRTVIRCEIKGQKWEMLQVVKDGVAKQQMNGRSIPLTDASMKELQLAALLNEIGQLTPLISDRKFNIKHDKQLKGQEISGLLVQVRGHPEFRLAFERKTGRLVRITYKEVDPESAKETEVDTTFDEFKAVSGLIRPTRSVVTRDGKKVMELNVEKFTPLEKIDPKVFALDQ